MGTWRGSMVAALAATLGRPAWWSMALAAFLVRGGIVLVLLPIVTLPTPAALETALSPTVSALAFGGVTGQVVAAVTVTILAVLAVLAAVGLAGAWLDGAQLHDAARDDEMDLRWSPVHDSARDALALRLAAHVPTLAALAYATFRLLTAGYEEFLSPGDENIPIVLRIAGRGLDAIAILVLAWLLGEAVGGLAARRAAAGASFGEALWRSVRQLAGLRGLATFTITNLAVAAALAPFMLAVGRAWVHVREVLLDGADPAFAAAALLVLIASWILGLAILGAALAWRGAAWTAEVAPGSQPSVDSAVVAARPTQA